MTDRVIKKFLRKYTPRKEVTGTACTNASNKRKCLLIVSTKSGFGNASRLGPKVAHRLAGKFSVVVVIPTQHHGHAREIMSNEDEQNLDEYDVAVILGGDGAFSEAADGMLSRNDGVTIPLAQCPGGSGCCIAGNTLGFWKGNDVEKACDVIEELKIRKIDVIQVECSDGRTRYAVSCMAGGINTDIIDLADHYRWTYYLFGPTFRYVIGMIKAFRSYGARDSDRMMKYTINDGEETFEKSTLGLALYNTGHVTDHARYAKNNLDDGNLGLVLNKTYSGFGKQMKYISALSKYNGEIDPAIHKDFADIHFATDVTSVKVEPVQKKSSVSERSLHISLDGEKGAGNGDWMVPPFTARVLPSKMNVIMA